MNSSTSLLDLHDLNINSRVVVFLIWRLKKEHVDWKHVDWMGESEWGERRENQIVNMTKWSVSDIVSYFVILQSIATPFIHTQSNSRRSEAGKPISQFSNQNSFQFPQEPLKNKQFECYATTYYYLKFEINNINSRCLSVWKLYIFTSIAIIIITIIME